MLGKLKIKLETDDRSEKLVANFITEKNSKSISEKISDNYGEVIVILEKFIEHKKKWTLKYNITK